MINLQQPRYSNKRFYGVAVSIADSDSADPGSIPGRTFSRILFCYFADFTVEHYQKVKCIFLV